VEDYALVEADFQQYYRLDVARLGFLRYARLFNQLPPESRVVREVSPAAAWTWRDETLSLILQEVSALNVVYLNAHRDPKKNVPALPAPEQFQPDHVKEAKEEYRKSHEQTRSDGDIDAMKALWESKNPGVKAL